MITLELNNWVPKVAIRPGSQPGKVDLSRLEPLKSEQVGFRWRHRQIQQAQQQLILCRVKLKIQKLFQNHTNDTIFMFLRKHLMDEDDVYSDF